MFNITDGTAILNAPTSLTDLNLASGGILDGDADVTVNDTFNFNGGGLSGNAPILVSSALNLATAAGATFRMRSDSTLSGDVAQDQTVDLPDIADLYFALGNREIGQRAFRGVLYYAALYAEALPPAAVMQNAAALLKNDDRQ